MAIEGHAAFGDHQTWYRITGELGSGGVPLVVLHGGPGCTHDYLLRLADLAGDRAVVHYDQLGNGKSTHLPDASPDFWTVELFLAELDNLLRTLGIADRYALLGQSWGGMLAAEHAARRPAGLRGLVIANSPASMSLWLAAADRLRAELPPEVEKTLRAHEADGTTDSQAYKDAVQVFYERHLCRVVPMPAEVAFALAEIDRDPTVYHAMNGPSEFHVIGSIRDWSIIDRVDAVSAPTLLVSGRHDEATPETVQPYFDRIPDVRWEIFEESSHMPHVEEPARFTEVVGGFLRTLS
ncbi:proline iminopeptidase-family hydrolase [Kutzneria sp. CA-103260]|uniref:proline iminopeptidase-family hydrolase n=1 Tax=Kutzneria sp. CA-103260 TaxID=2802641 RepID=UPI001BA6D248|nr:proline iminopeptidase-family hydrolase [Kutzneria sp. CA-103260]QUQ63023.1 proline imino-peptidase [Kutzneria sp. CA-103260]